MNCPFCDKEMKEGKLYNSGRSVPLIWLPEGKRYPFIYSEKKINKRNGMSLGEVTYIYPVSITAYMCAYCRKGIFMSDD